jgi:hypothetical protein
MIKRIAILIVFWVGEIVSYLYSLTPAYNDTLCKDLSQVCSALGLSLPIVIVITVIVIGSIIIEHLPTS